MFGRYVVGGRLDPPYHPTKVMPQFVGRTILVPSAQRADRVIKDKFYLSDDVEFYAISVKVWPISPEDYWNLIVDGQIIAKNIYCKEWEEGIYFQVAYPVEKGKEFVFEFHTPHGDRKQIEVLYHFLTDMYVNLVVTGTTEIINPLPEQPPITEEPPSIQLPVQWSPFNSVEEATQWAESLGVEVDFQDNLLAANYITEGLAFLLNNCGGFANMIQKHKLIIKIDNMVANGYFNPPTGEVAINKYYDFANADKIAQMEYLSGQKSSPHKLRTIIHEIGHWLHFYHVGEEEFYRLAALDPDNYGAESILNPDDASYIASQAGQYATSWFPMEYIAEVFTAKVTGVSLDPKIMEWYEQYGGFECSEW